MIFNWNHVSNFGSQQVDYSKYSNDQLLDQFKTENWSSISEKGKVDVLQEIENRNAAQQGREPATVISSSSITSYGSYNNMSHQININVNHFSSYEVLDTYVHESNHAFQNYCIENGIGYDEYSRNMMEVELARDSNGNLYNYANMSPQYDMQCNELDSNNTAARFLMSESDRYKSDQEYKEYINERTDHFNEVNLALDNYQALRTSMQNNQVYTSYVRSDISEQQYTFLSDSINNSEHIDPMVQESQFLGEEVSQLNTVLNQDIDISESQSADEGEDIDLALNDNDNDNTVSY